MFIYIIQAKLRGPTHGTTNAVNTRRKVKKKPMYRIHLLVLSYLSKKIQENRFSRS